MVYTLINRGLNENFQPASLLALQKHSAQLHICVEQLEPYNKTQDRMFTNKVENSIIQATNSYIRQGINKIVRIGKIVVVGLTFSVWFLKKTRLKLLQVDMWVTVSNVHVLTACLSRKSLNERDPTCHSKWASPLLKVRETIFSYESTGNWACLFICSWNYLFWEAMKLQWHHIAVSEVTLKMHRFKWRMQLFC